MGEYDWKGDLIDDYMIDNYMIVEGWLFGRRTCSTQEQRFLRQSCNCQSCNLQFPSASTGPRLPRVPRSVAIRILPTF